MVNPAAWCWRRSLDFDSFGISVCLGRAMQTPSLRVSRMACFSPSFPLESMMRKQQVWQKASSPLIVRALSLPALLDFLGLAPAFNLGLASVVERKTASPWCLHPVRLWIYVTWHGKGDLVNVTMDLSMENSLGLLGLSPKQSHEGPCKWKEEVARKDWKLLCCWHKRWRKGSQTKECRGPLEAGKS